MLVVSRNGAHLIEETGFELASIKFILVFFSNLGQISTKKIEEEAFDDM